MPVLKWIAQKPHKYFVLCPAWEKQDELDHIERYQDLAEWLDKHRAPSGWWQIKSESRREFMYWCGADTPEEKRVLLRGLHVSDQDPSMLAIGAGWVETNENGDYTGRVTDVNYALHDRWVLFMGTTYEFLKALAEQMKRNTV